MITWLSASRLDCGRDGPAVRIFGQSVPPRTAAPPIPARCRNERRVTGDANRLRGSVIVMPPEGEVYRTIIAVVKRWDEFYMPSFGTTAYENGLGCRSRGRMRLFALVGPKSPRMSLTLDAVENGRRQPWKFCTRGAAGWMYTSRPLPNCIVIAGFGRQTRGFRRSERHIDDPSQVGV